jgi:hypothetical protein
MSQVGTETSIFVDKYDVTLDVCISSVFLQTKIPNHSCVYPISMHPFVPNFANNLIFCLIYPSIEVMKKNSLVPSKQHVTETWICMHLKMKLLKGKMFNQLDMHTRLGYNDGLLATSNSLLYPPSMYCILCL